MNYDNLRDNSIKNRQSSEEQNKPVLINQGNARMISRKPSLEKKIMGIVFPGNIQDIKEHMIFDVLIPRIRDGIWDMLNDGLSILFSGSVRKKASNPNPQYSRTAYGSYYYGDSSSKNTPRYSKDPPPLNELSWPTKEEAISFREDLIEYLSHYGTLTVANVYDQKQISLMNWEGPNKWGWRSLGKADVEQVRYEDGEIGWVINFPKPEYLG